MHRRVLQQLRTYSQAHINLKKVTCWMSKVFIFETKHLLQAPTPEAGHRNQTCCFRRSKRFTYFSGMKPAAQSSAFKTFSLQVQQSYTEAKREWCASNRHLIELTHARRIGISSNPLMRRSQYTCSSNNMSYLLCPRWHSCLSHSFLLANAWYAMPTLGNYLIGLEIYKTCADSGRTARQSA